MSPTSINIFLIKSTFKELNPADKLTYITYCIGLGIGAIIFIVNSFLDYKTPKYVSFFVITAILISGHLYFNLKKHFTSSLLVVLFFNLSIFYLCYNVGLATAYFMYAYVLLCAIPFLTKRNKHYFRNNIILIIITLLSTTVSIMVSPQYNPENLSVLKVNQKLLTNSVLSFGLFMTFAFFIVIVYSNIIVALIKAKKNAEKQKDTKTLVLSNLGHELRTQLSNIHGITQLLLEQNEKDELSDQSFSQYTETLEVCSNQMLFLVNDILDIHKIESGNFKLNSQPENLIQLLTQAITPFKSIATDKNLVFDVTIDPMLTNNYYNIDASRLTQVLQNLISNALKYTNKGFVNFSARVESQDENHTTVSFSIKDSGIGIAEEHVLKVFDSFQQFRDENSPYAGGTGLGLAISKTIVEKMGSQINVKSTLKVGSIFTFTLKLKKAPYLSKQIKTINTPEELTTKLHGKKILITEDNKISMLYASKLLEKNGARVLKAYNGLEAVQIAKVHPDISLILLDLEMPVMNGFSAIKHLKEIDSSLKVIAFTANIPDNSLFERLNSLNFNDFLAKPFKNEDMFSILNKHLDS